MKTNVLAQKIIEQKAKVTHVDDGWHFDLIETLGVERTFYQFDELPKGSIKGLQPPTRKTTKAEATQLAVEWLAFELEENIVLSDTWAKDNLKNS